MNYAGFWLRFFASILDDLFIFAVILIVLVFSAFGKTTIYKIWEVYSSSWFIFIYLIFETMFVASKLQATPGKRLLRIYIGNAKDSSKISMTRSFARYLVALTTCILFPVGIVSGLMLIFSKEKASIHDRICKTRVFCGKP